MKKKYAFLTKNSKKILMAVLISMIWITTLTPVVLSGATDTVTITFDPNGSISIDVSPGSYAFGSIMAGQWVNTSASYFTIFNNGTIGMDTKINATAKSTGGMDLDTDGTPGADDYSLRVLLLDTANYYITTSLTEVDDDIPAGAASHKHFTLCLNMGSSLTQNWTSQTAAIYFEGHSIE